MPAKAKAKPQIQNPWPASKVHMWPLDRIKPYSQNPRTHPEAEIAALARDMIEDGVTMPILVDEAGMIVAGHGRLLAAARNGFKQYPVVIAKGWTEKQKRAVRLKDNQRALQASWAPELLRLEIQQLQLDDYDLPLLGFDKIELTSILNSNSGIAPAEETPPAPKHPVSRRGDLWTLGRHRLLCGDATAKDDIARCLGDAKPNLMVTDPPYGVDYDPSWRRRAKVSMNPKKMGMVTNDNRSDWREAWMLFPGDVIYCWHAGRHASSVELSLTASGFDIIAQIIWAKDRMALSRGDYHWQHEPCWYSVRSGKPHQWVGARNKTTLWQIPSREDSGHGHGTQKPIECMKRPIENNSSPGDAVYEPFSGSGTTIIAAEMTARSCLAIEIDPAYVDVAVLRWEKFTGQKATLDGKPFEQVRRDRQRANSQRRSAPVRKGRRGNESRAPGLDATPNI